MKNRICIKFFTLVLLSATLLVSCADEEKGIVETQPSNEGKLTLKVSPTTRGDSENEIEKINSLRLILLDKDGKVKANILQTYQEKSAEDFEETFEFDLALGEYKVYAIVNEESIKNFKLEGREDVSDQTLSEVLNGYFYGNSGIEDFLNNIYFAPDYTRAIPYSSCYTISVDKPEVAANVYLVPVATKLEINFQNYRNDPVIFNEIIIDKIADNNYLMAKIPEEYQYFEEKYWIDWLKEVADDTNLHPELSEKEDSNELINQKWGWLRNYFMPEATTHEGVNIIEPGNVLEVAASSGQAGDKPIPGEEKLECIYIPESKNTDGGPEQNYGLTFKIQLNDGYIKEIQADLGYVETLFRNTHVRVNVELYAGSEEIYAQIVRWKETDYSYGEIKPE